MTSLWSYINCVFHVVPTNMKNLLIEDLQSQKVLIGGAGEIEDNITKIDFDLPGMISMNRSWQHIKIDTLNISIPNTDIEQVLCNLKLSALEKFSDGTPYYKLYGYLKYIVLTLEQRDLMIEALEEILTEAMRIAEIENEVLQNALDNINKGTIKVVSYKDKKNKNKKGMN